MSVSTEAFEQACNYLLTVFRWVHNAYCINKYVTFTGFCIVVKASVPHIGLYLNLCAIRTAIRALSLF